MSALQPLNILLEQAGAERDTAQAAHQQTLQAHVAAQRQAQQLEDYRRDHAQRFGSQFQRSGAIELLQCYQGFMGRLDEAVGQQQRSVAQSLARVHAAQTTLLAAELRVASVRKLIERRVAEAGRARDRVEQKISDEFAARAAWQRLANGQAGPGMAFGGL